MCLTADEVSHLCDACLAKQRLSNEQIEPCDLCKKSLEHYCQCCTTHSPVKVIDGCCKECISDRWCEDGSEVE